MKITRAIGVVALFGTLLGGPGTASASLLTDLQGYWSFNGTASDLSGNGRDLNLVGGATYSAGGLSGGQALNLTRIEGQGAVRPVSDPVFNFGSSDFTIQIWVNFNGNLNNNQEQTLIEKLTGAGAALDSGWTLTMPSNSVEFPPQSGVDAANYQSQMSLHQWYDFVVRRSGNETDLFINDSLVASSIGSYITGDSASPLLIGARDAGDGRNFTVDGLINDAAIWTRALGNGEIAQIYNNGTGLDLAATPVPAALPLFATGLAGLGLFGWRRKRKDAAAIAA
jgi:hypothetical protein